VTNNNPFVDYFSLVREADTGTASARMPPGVDALILASFRRVPKSIVLDLDHTFDAVHGGQ
jgi:hypothetical protein